MFTLILVNGVCTVRAFKASDMSDIRTCLIGTRDECIAQGKRHVKGVDGLQKASKLNLE